MYERLSAETDGDITLRCRGGAGEVQERCRGGAGAGGPLYPNLSTDDDLRSHGAVEDLDARCIRLEKG